jgi:hypothetical protein
MDWCAALCSSGSEGGLFSKFSGSEFPVYWPRQEVEVIEKGRRGTRIRSVASGYLFLKFCLDDGEAWHRAMDLAAPKMRGFIGGERPTAVPEAAFAVFRDKYGAGPDGLFSREYVEEDEEPFQVGDEVRVLVGEDTEYPGSGRKVPGIVNWSNKQGTHITWMMLGRESPLFIPRGVNIIELIRGVGDKNKFRAPQYGREGVWREVNKKNFTRAFR